MAKKGSSKHRQAGLQQYKSEGRSLKNRTKRLQAYVKKNPNDVQAANALKNGLVDYRRKTPRTSHWTPDKKKLAHTLRILGYNGNAALLDSKIWFKFADDYEDPAEAKKKK